MQFISLNPATGDAGLSPVIIVLGIICAVIVLGCLVWAFFIGKRHNDITATNANELGEHTTDHTVVEPIEPEQQPNEPQDPAEPENSDKE